MALLASRSLKVIGLLTIALLFVSGCGKKITMDSGMAPKWGRIAVMPVINKTTEPQASALLRTYAIEAIYNKGYKKLPAQIIDEQLAENARETPPPPPQVAGKVLGVDALLYCTLTEWKKSEMTAYASISATATFELRSAANGEVLWHNSQTIVKRSVHPFKKELQELMLMDFESSVVELVDSGMASLPTGSDFIAKDPLKKSKYEGWF